MVLPSNNLVDIKYCFSPRPHLRDSRMNECPQYPFIPFFAAKKLTGDFGCVASFYKVAILSKIFIRFVNRPFHNDSKIITCMRGSTL